MFFADKWILWILVPLYLAWLAGWLAVRAIERHGRASAALRFSSIKTLKQIRPSLTLRLRRWVEGLRIIAIALLVVAMARPQTGRKESKVSSEGIDIMLAIDTSGSMKALDLDIDKPIGKRRNRLEVVRGVVEKFIQKRENDQIGMVVFGQDAFTQCPLTLDHGIVATFLEQVEIGMAGDMTAIGPGIGTAVNRLKKSSAKSKVIILLTDGRSNAGALSPKQAAEVAKSFGIKIYTIGAGALGKAPFIVDSLFGKQIVYDDVDIDEATLKEVAEVTGGAYFRAEDSTALEKIYDHIDAMEKTEVEMKAYLEYNERFGWFVMPAVGLLLAEIVLLGTRFRKIP